MARELKFGVGGIEGASFIEEQESNIVLVRIQKGDELKPSYKGALGNGFYFCQSKEDCLTQCCDKNANRVLYCPVTVRNILILEGGAYNEMNKISSMEGIHDALDQFLFDNKPIKIEMIKRIFDDGKAKPEYCIYSKHLIGDVIKVENV